MKTSLLIYVSLFVLIFVSSGCGPLPEPNVRYTVEWKEDDTCIKFEDAMIEIEDDEWIEACLGEEGVQEYDTFLIDLDGDPDTINVAVKAGKCGKNKNEDIFVELEVADPVEGMSAWHNTICDFEVWFIGPIPYIEPGDYYQNEYEGYYILQLGSDDDARTPALSNVMVCFEGDAVTVTILDPQEGEYMGWRELD